jgi:ubiquinol-cytochrome c reductase iron-sulfur subunit
MANARECSMYVSSGFTRRHFLTVATAVTAGAGAAATAVPFVSSFKPSARAQALGAPVERDVSKLEPGSMVKVEWRGKAIYIVRRTPEMQNKLREVADLLKDPNSENTEQHGMPRLSGMFASVDATANSGVRPTARVASAAATTTS